MANYLLGLGGKCCADCTPNNPCKARPVVGGNGVTTCAGEFFSISGSWGSNTPTSRTITGLPSGVSYNTGTNILSGTPTSAGTTVCTATATNACGTNTDSGNVTITVGTRITITSALTATGLPDTAFSYTITSTGSPTSFSATGLPSGLSINTATGVISGTPPACGPTNVAIEANDGGLCPAQATLVITIETPFCHLTLDTAGGDAGYDNTFDVTGDFTSARNIYVDFESYTVKDQLLIYANGSLVYDSGCIGARVMPTVAMPAGTTNSRVVVVANCEGTTGTLWVLGITCA